MKESWEPITWVRTNVCSITRLFMMSSLSQWAATAAMQAPTSLAVVNIYPPPIIAAPSGLRAAACWVNRGWRWEINEQCASGSGWEQPLMAGVLLKAMTCTWGKGHRGPRQIPHSRHPLITGAQTAAAKVTFYRAPCWLNLCLVTGLTAF